MRWEAAVMTAPGRKWPTLRATLESLEAAGWSDVLISCDTNAAETIDQCGNMILRYRSTGEKRLGPWPHLLDLLRHELGFREWDLLLICQDDVQLARRLRPLLEQLSDYELLDPAVGVRSLWLPSWHSTKSLHSLRLHDAPKDIRWWTLSGLPKEAYGALALVFHRASAEQLVDTVGAPDGMTRADFLLGRWCKARGLDWLYPTRSFCQHTGDRNSSIDNTPRYGPYRVALNPVLDCGCVPDSKMSADTL